MNNSCLLLHVVEAIVSELLRKTTTIITMKTIKATMKLRILKSGNFIL